MTITGRTRPVAALFIAGAVAASMLGTTATASAGGTGLDVTTVAPVAWAAHHAFPVTSVVRNRSGQLLCGQIQVRTTWLTRAGAHRSSTMVGESVSAVFTASTSIPAGAIRRGTLRYAVTASQRCGILDGNAEYLGRFPVTGWSRTTVT